MSIANTCNMVQTEPMPRTQTPAPKTAAQRRADAVQALNDDTRLVVSLSQAALLLGVAVSTACRAAATTGRLTSDVPAIRVAGTRRARWVVAKADLRRVLQRSPSRAAPDDGLVP
jgi:hypothetical protein